MHIQKLDEVSIAPPMSSTSPHEKTGKAMEENGSQSPLR